MTAELIRTTASSFFPPRKVNANCGDRMSEFTKEEIAAEVQRRRDAIKCRDTEHLESMRKAERNGCDTVCLSCCTPVKSYMVTDPQNPFCDTCMDY